MVKLIACFVRDETAATSIEYALIGTLISIAIIAGALALGSKLDIVYSSVASKVPVVN